MENVRGMANWQNGAALRAIEEAIAEPITFNGKKYRYDIQHQILNSANFGCPQFRERIFIVGNRIEKDFKFPQQTHGKVRDQIGLFAEHEIKPFVTVWDAIGKLPPADEPSDMAKRVSQTIKGRIKKHGY